MNRLKHVLRSNVPLRVTSDINETNKSMVGLRRSVHSQRSNLEESHQTRRLLLTAPASLRYPSDLIALRVDARYFAERRYSGGRHPEKVRSAARLGERRSSTSKIDDGSKPNTGGSTSRSKLDDRSENSKSSPRSVRSNEVDASNVEPQRRAALLDAAAKGGKMARRTSDDRDGTKSVEDAASAIKKEAPVVGMRDARSAEHVLRHLVGGEGDDVEGKGRESAENVSESVIVVSKRPARVELHLESDDSTVDAAKSLDKENSSSVSIVVRSKEDRQAGSSPKVESVPEEPVRIIFGRSSSAARRLNLGRNDQDKLGEFAGSVESKARMKSGDVQAVDADDEMEIRIFLPRRKASSRRLVDLKLRSGGSSAALTSTKETASSINDVTRVSTASNRKGQPLTKTYELSKALPLPWWARIDPLDPKEGVGGEREKREPERPGRKPTKPPGRSPEVPINEAKLKGKLEGDQRAIPVKTKASVVRAPLKPAREGSATTKKKVTMSETIARAKQSGISIDLDSLKARRRRRTAPSVTSIIKNELKKKHERLVDAKAASKKLSDSSKASGRRDSFQVRSTSALKEKGLSSAGRSSVEVAGEDSNSSVKRIEGRVTKKTMDHRVPSEDLSKSANNERNPPITASFGVKGKEPPASATPSNSKVARKIGNPVRGNEERKTSLQERATSQRDSSTIRSEGTSPTASSRVKVIGKADDSIAGDIERKTRLAEKKTEHRNPSKAHLQSATKKTESLSTAPPKVEVKVAKVVAETTERKAKESSLKREAPTESKSWWKLAINDAMSSSAFKSIRSKSVPQLKPQKDDGKKSGSAFAEKNPGSKLRSEERVASFDFKRSGQTMDQRGSKPAAEKAETTKIVLRKVLETSGEPVKSRTTKYLEPKTSLPVRSKESRSFLGGAKVAGFEPTAADVEGVKRRRDAKGEAIKSGDGTDGASVKFDNLSPNLKKGAAIDSKTGETGNRGSRKNNNPNDGKAADRRNKGDSGKGEARSTEKSASAGSVGGKTEPRDPNPRGSSAAGGKIGPKDSPGAISGGSSRSDAGKSVQGAGRDVKFARKGGEEVSKSHSARPKNSFDRSMSVEATAGRSKIDIKADGSTGGLVEVERPEKNILYTAWLQRFESGIKPMKFS